MAFGWLLVISKSEKQNTNKTEPEGIQNWYSLSSKKFFNHCLPASLHKQKALQCERFSGIPTNNLYQIMPSLYAFFSTAF